MTAPTHDAIAIRAYHIWEGEGRPHGRHDRHWLTAEAAEFGARAEAQVPAAALAATPEPAVVRPAPAKRAASARKAAPSAKPATAKAAAAKVAAPKAPAEAVVAAAALEAPRAARATKASRSAH